MFAPDLWKFLEHYRELIINSLDLASFLLVTPELARYVRPAMTKFVYWTGGTIIVIGVVSLQFMLLFTGKVLPRGVLSFIALPFLIVCLIWLLNAWYERGEGPVSDWAGAHAARHAFRVGVALFLASRLLAFIIAVLQVLNED